MSIELAKVDTPYQGAGAQGYEIHLLALVSVDRKPLGYGSHMKFLWKTIFKCSFLELCNIQQSELFALYLVILQNGNSRRKENNSCMYLRPWNTTHRAARNLLRQSDFSRLFVYKIRYLQFENFLFYLFAVHGF